MLESISVDIQSLLVETKVHAVLNSLYWAFFLCCTCPSCDVFIRPFFKCFFFFFVFYYIFLACCFQCQDSLPLTTPLSFSPFVVTAFREIIVYYVLSAFIVHQSFLLLSVKGLIQTNYFAI